MNPLDRRQLSREIWQEVFGDDDRFLDLYFGRVYQDSETDLLVDYASAPKAIAHTGRVSYAFRVWGERIEAAYISGAATLASERGRGLMPALLRSAHTRMYQTGKLLAFLIPAEPWLYDYYQRKFGYAKVCYRSVSRSISPNLTPPPLLYKQANTEGYIHYIQQRQRWTMGHLEHTYPQWKCVIEDALLSGGGYAQEGVIRLLEGGECSQFVATQLPIAEGLAYHQVVTPPLGKGLEPHGMMRVVKIPQLLALYAKKHPNVEWQFDLLDAMLRPNTGRYRLEKGKCLFSPLPPKFLQKNILTPSLLLDQLFAENPFYIDLMLD